ncbi:hypothetical protein ACFSL6_08760 [Paenibacillus thailandensis]|uniref:Uncharacterized protein n=1 Tax=Paenibacillus thailandensis TaxID=393250 RepID=A0ABW5QSS4_9BACL
MIERLEELAARCMQQEAYIRELEAKIEALEKENALYAIYGEKCVPQQFVVGD